MLQNKELLQKRKNLLAFSAGGDSTALLFLLKEQNIAFDIAIVDYGVRAQSKEEVAYALSLAKEFGFVCHVHNAITISSGFEAKAREIRYTFFEDLIKKHAYENLLTAHHLGDRFEWMLMQFCRGAGCVELSGMKAVEQRVNYRLVRPLLHLDKQELLSYLDEQKIKYFEDESNTDENYTRNTFRHNHSNPLLAQHLQGIKKSFEYMDEDVASLVEELEIKSCNKLAYFKTSHSQRSNIAAIDKYLKLLGHLTTASEKKLLKEENSIVIGRAYIVAQSGAYTFIAPFIQAKEIEKKLKEKLRLLKVAPKLRGYLAEDSEAVELVSLLLQ